MSGIYGMVAEFDDPDDALAGAERIYAEGYRKIDAYTPFPVHGMTDAIGFNDSKVQWTVFIAGVVGGIGGFLTEVYINGIEYPHNVGGRPLLSWPQFIPVAYETTILCAAFGAVLGMILFNGLPRPYQSIFNAKNFERASQDRFFLFIERKDPKFDLEGTEAFLRTLGAQSVSTVEQ